MLFQNGKHLFGQVTGYDFDQIQNYWKWSTNTGFMQTEIQLVSCLCFIPITPIIKLLKLKSYANQVWPRAVLVDHASILDAEGLRSAAQELRTVELSGTCR